MLGSLINEVLCDSATVLGKMVERCEACCACCVHGRQLSEQQRLQAMKAGEAAAERSGILCHQPVIPAFAQQVHGQQIVTCGVDSDGFLREV